jgi:hypothetical protein
MGIGILENWVMVLQLLKTGSLILAACGVGIIVFCDGGSRL